MITICFVYFKNLTLANLAAALYSVRRQDLSTVKMLVVIDNDTQDTIEDISTVINALDFPVPVKLMSYKHSDATKTHAWSSNIAVAQVETPWVLFTRADYLLSFDLVKKFTRELDYAPNWNGFITSNGCHLNTSIDECERTDWRQTGPMFEGAVFDYTLIDTGVYLIRKEAFDKVSGLDESLTAWGHAQTEFQYRLFKSGVEFVRIPETLFWHPWHGGEKDIDLAHRQLVEQGGDLHTMWARYHGASPY